MEKCIQSALECQGRPFSPSQVGAGTPSPICDHRIWSAVWVEGTGGGSRGERRIFSRMAEGLEWEAGN